MFCFSEYELTGIEPWELSIQYVLNGSDNPSFVDDGGIQSLAGIADARRRVWEVPNNETAWQQGVHVGIYQKDLLLRENRGPGGEVALKEDIVPPSTPVGVLVFHKKQAGGRIRL